MTAFKCFASVVAFVAVLAGCTLISGGNDGGVSRENCELLLDIADEGVSSDDIRLLEAAGDECRFEILTRMSGVSSELCEEAMGIIEGGISELGARTLRVGYRGGDSDSCRYLVAFKPCQEPTLLESLPQDTRNTMCPEL